MAALQVLFSIFLNGLDGGGIECDSNIQRALSWEGNMKGRATIQSRHDQSEK